MPFYHEISVLSIAVRPGQKMRNSEFVFNGKVSEMLNSVVGIPLSFFFFFFKITHQTKSKREYKQFFWKEFRN